MVAIHYYQPNASGSGFQLPFNAIAWIGLTALLGVGCFTVAKRGAVRFSPLLPSLCFSSLLLLLPFFYADFKIEYAAGKLIAIFAGLLFLLVLQQFRFTPAEVQLLLILVLIGIWVEAMIGWWQFLDGLYFDRSLNGTQIRPYGIFQQPNVMASLMATGLVLSAYLLGARLQPGRFSRIIYGLCAITPLLTIHLLVALASRAGWLGAAIGTALIIPYLLLYSARRYFITWVAMVIVGLSMSVIFTPTAGWAPPEKEIISLAGVRTITMPQTIDMALAKPLRGYGYGNFEVAYIQYTARQHALDDSYPPGYPRLDHPHNELLYWLVEGGVIALLALLVAAYLVWRRVWRHPWKNRLAYIALFFPLVLHTQVEFPFYVSLVHYVIFLFLIFLVDQQDAAYREIRVGGAAFIAGVGIFVPLVTAVFMLTSLQTGKVIAAYESGDNSSLEPLVSVVNPVGWRDVLDWDIRSRLLITGILQGNMQLVDDFLLWIPELIESQPRPEYYQFMILAYTYTGDEEKVTETSNTAYYLFPEESFELQDINRGLFRAD